MATDTKQQYDETGKVVFNDHYNQPDPRAYFANLGALDYRIAGEAQPFFDQTLAALRSARDLSRVNVIDLGCSYGINASLMKCDITLDDLQARYRDPSVADLEPEEVLERDVAWYREQRKDGDISTVGIDTAEKAVDYGQKAGLLQAGITTNLEEEPLKPEEAELLRDADLVMSTGCIGYVSETSIRKILDATSEKRPWMAHFVLRMFPFEPYRELLRDHGYVTAKLNGTVRQRRFANPEEQEHVLDNLRELGIDPAGLESEGWYHAEFYLSRPADEADTPVKIER